MGNTQTIETIPINQATEEGKSLLTKDILHEGKALTLEEARYFVDIYYSLQKVRVATGNREFAAKESEESSHLVEWLAKNMEWLEKQITRPLQKYVENFAEGRWAQSQKGIGTVLAAGCIVYIKPEITITAGKVWKTFGLVPGQKRKRGEKLDYNPSAKILAWKIGQSFVKVSGNPDAFYGQAYKQRKAYEQEKNEKLEYADQAKLILETKNISKSTEAYKWYVQGKLPPAHIQQRSERWAAKLFLSHFSQVRYETQFGKPWPKPFVEAHLGHVDIITPPGYTPLKQEI